MCFVILNVNLLSAALFVNGYAAKNVIVKMKCEKNLMAN